MPKKSKPKKKTTTRGRGVRYSAKKRESLLSKYRELRQGGMNAQKAAGQVKVSYLTLRKWEKEAKLPKIGKRGRQAGKASKRAEKPQETTVNVTALLKKALKTKPGRSTKAKTVPKSKGGMTLVTPSGYRIEGITSKNLLQVLKALR
jgi:hypothetical protein